MPDRVLIVGALAAESLETSYARAFDHLGWAVDRWDPVSNVGSRARGLLAGRIFARFVRVEPWVRKANADLLRLVAASGPSLILVIGTEGVRPGSLGQIRARHPRVPVYCLYPDSPHSLDADRILCLPLFTRVTVSSPDWVATMTRLGGREVGYLPFAADTLYHVPTGEQGRADQNLGFIGTWRPEREQVLEALADLGLHIWGGGYWRWRTRSGSTLRRCWVGGPAIGQGFVEACAQTRIMLNILDVTSWPGPNMRAFELAACGAFALTERTTPFTEIFPEGTASACFSSVAEARDKARFYLANGGARVKIGQAAHRIATEAGHTYLNRAEQIVRWVAEDAS